MTHRVAAAEAFGTVIVILGARQLSVNDDCSRITFVSALTTVVVDGRWAVVRLRQFAV